LNEGGNYDFESLDKTKDPTGINLLEKEALVRVLIDYGIPYL
jgi:hypothetical protein